MLTINLPNFTFTKDINHAIENSNISFVSVPTPTTPEGIDLSYIKEAAKNIVGLDPRIGKYGSVHGKAFGGKCLPKDLKAFISFAEKYRNVRLLRELPVNSLPVLIIIIDTDFTDLHRCYSPDY